ncbi:MAG: hypothetical protein A2289_08505 [Deltaproteobacteria bacterium RIFOXYA12_FULL_58_15]|nr:MAG: hypothetical protein A2289_08505 [Deltaproteobacteria bacterium RIFOXYA12_FULL_58_15]OGR10826.1 MAG: hypothetical protein A2341_23515 [Deltaproteobacteria bacterium RIFOXYB12_FULL_58_9]
MAKKRWSKQKSGTQTGKQRKSRVQGDASAGGAGGTVGGMRRLMKTLAGTGRSKGPKSPVEKTFDVILWIAVIAAVGFAIFKRCG